MLTLLLLNTIMAVQAEMEGFIVGGYDGDIQEYPYVVNQFVVCTTKIEKLTFTCGSSILNQKILLTAAHCLEPCTGYPTKITVSVGHTQKNMGTIREVTSYIIHANYKPAEMNCDIGMMKVDLKINLNSLTKRVAIVQHPPYRQPAKLAGWGLVDEITRERGFNLKYLDQQVYRPDMCKKMLGSLPRGTICAGSPNGVGAPGDSGSPLVVKTYIQIGITSFKRPFIRNDIAVYTDTGYYYQWITSHAAWLYCDGKLNLK